MPTETSKCSTPYTTNCVGSAKTLHTQDSPSPGSVGPEGLAGCDAGAAPKITMRTPSLGTYAFVEGARSESRVELEASVIRVAVSDLLVLEAPVRLAFGPLEMCISEEQALALADALVRGVHRRRAHIAAASADSQQQDSAA